MSKRFENTIMGYRIGTVLGVIVHLPCLVVYLSKVRGGGGQYVMKTAQYGPKFYIYTLHNYFYSLIKRSVSWLNKCKIAVVELLT